MSERVTMQDIEARINRKKSAFYEKRYDGKILPEFMEIFKKAIMRVVPSRYQIRSEGVKKIINKPIDELSFLEVGFMLNIIKDLPFAEYNSNLDEALANNEIVVSIFASYNSLVEKMVRELEVEKATSMKLAGLTNAAPFATKLAQA